MHGALIQELSKVLNGSLPEGLAAFPEEHVYVLVPEDRIVPEVAVVRQPNVATAPLRSSGGVAVASKPLDIAQPLSEDARIPYLEIVTTHGERRVVAV